MNYDNGSMNWIEIQHQIHEMRRETEAWVAQNEMFRLEREAKKAEVTSQRSHVDFIQRLKRFMADLLNARARFFRKR